MPRFFRPLSRRSLLKKGAVALAAPIFVPAQVFAARDRPASVI